MLSRNIIHPFLGNLECLLLPICPHLNVGKLKYKIIKVGCNIPQITTICFAFINSSITLSDATLEDAMTRKIIIT